jgi:transposase InsO family protein
MLKRQNLVINHKRTERIYKEEGLALRRKRRRKGAAGVRVVMPAAERPNQMWSMDFVTDSLIIGRKFRALTIIDKTLFDTVLGCFHIVKGAGNGRVKLALPFPAYYLTPN